MVGKYRKRPVVIEAMKYIGTVGSAQEAMSFMDGHAVLKRVRDDAKGIEDYAIAIPTLEGEMLANPGDWIIKGINGEFYPCKPDIFTKTYELVED